MYKDISMFWGMLGVFFWWDVVFIGYGYEQMSLANNESFKVAMIKPQIIIIFIYV